MSNFTILPSNCAVACQLLVHPIIHRKQPIVCERFHRQKRNRLPHEKNPPKKRTRERADCVCVEQAKFSRRLCCLYKIFLSVTYREERTAAVSKAPPAPGIQLTPEAGMRFLMRLTASIVTALKDNCRECAKISDSVVRESNRNQGDKTMLKQRSQYDDECKKNAVKLSYASVS
jgi:hypothetical protein